MTLSKEAIATGFIALAGAVVGAAATGCVQYVLQAKQDSYAEQQQRLDVAQKIITLEEESSVSMLSETQEIHQVPPHISTLANNPERVVALATLYFPTAVKAALGYESESAEYLETLTGAVKPGGKFDAKANQLAYFCSMEAGDQVRIAVLEALHRPYDERAPVVPLSSCKDYQYELTH
jgi:hypothetical protein